MNPIEHKDAILYALSAIATSFALPFLISWLKEETWSDRTKTIISLVLCFGGATIVTFINGQVNLDDLVTTFGIVFLLTQSYYALYFKHQPWNVLLTQKESPIKNLIEH